MRISDWSSDVCSSDRLRLVHDAVVGAAHPVIEPAQTFLQIADGRSRHAGVGKAVAPGTHQGLPWNIDCLNRLEHGADIGSVGPAADGLDRALDAAEVGHRTLSPEVTVGLVLQDCDDEWLHVSRSEMRRVGKEMVMTSRT